jgi:hypothetical protein
LKGFFAIDLCFVHKNKEEVMSNSEDEIAGPHGTCERVKDDGSNCRAPARQGSRYCFFHDPAKENERKEAQQRGGRANRATVLRADAPDVPLNSLKDSSVYMRE